MDLTLPAHLYVDNAQAWQQCLADLQRVDRFALDLESNGLFVYREAVCLIQISTLTADYIIDPLAGLDLAPFGVLVGDPAIEKVLHASEYDLILLERTYGWALRNLYDTMWAARILGYDRIGLANMLESLYGMTISKKHQRANWCHRPLTVDELTYAQTDTHYLLRMRDDLAARLATGGHTLEAAEIFAEAEQVNLPQVAFSEDSFWSINGVQDLTPQQRAILRELNIARDKIAQDLNRPPFKVMGNQALLDLTQQAPRNSGTLFRMKGLNNGLVRRHGDALLAAIARGQQATPPRPPRRERVPDDVMARYDKLHNWRKERAAARGVASDVILTRNVLWAIARANPQNVAQLAQIPFMGAWRLAHYGPEILAALRA